MGNTYQPRVKFEVALEAVVGDKSQAQIAEASGVHPSTVAAWKNELLEKGPDVFASQSVIADFERRIADLEQLVGQKEFEIARLRAQRF